MQIYAGIGARNTPKYILSIMKDIGIYLAGEGWTLNTGAAKGADQSFTEGALKGKGTVNLFLPWPTYENKWVSHLHGNVNITVFNPEEHFSAVQSVHNFHPAGKNLKSSVCALHARNYLILNGIKFVVCYTPNGKIVGGTGQAIRIINHRRKNLFNLGNNQDLQKILDKL